MRKHCLSRCAVRDRRSLTHKQACIAAGIGQSTLADWRERYPDLQHRMEEAREVARQTVLSAIKTAGRKDWRALAEWLKLCFPADYRRWGAEVTVTATPQQHPVHLVCDQATRKAIIEERRKLLEEGPKALPEPEQFKLQAGTPIGPTIVPEDPSVTQMKSLEGCISGDQVRWADLGRFGNTDLACRAAVRQRSRTARSKLVGL
jgi:hypothetical protein